MLSHSLIASGATLAQSPGGTLTLTCRLASPRRTIATAQTLYHRFHLYHPLADYQHTDVAISALLSAAKLEDTLKKLRDIQIAAWAVSNMLEGGTGIGEGDPQQQEGQRPKLIAIERYILETLCFNLHPHKGLKAMTSAALAGLAKGESEVAGATRDVFGWVMRLAKAMDGEQRHLFQRGLDLLLTLISTLQPPSRLCSFRTCSRWTCTARPRHSPTRATPSHSRASTSPPSSPPATPTAQSGRARPWPRRCAPGHRCWAGPTAGPRGGRARTATLGVSRRQGP